MLLLPPLGWVLDDYNQVVMKPSEKLKERHLYPLHRVYVVPIHFKYVRSLKKYMFMCVAVMIAQLLQFDWCHLHSGSAKL